MLIKYSHARLTLAVSLQRALGLISLCHKFDGNAERKCDSFVRECVCVGSMQSGEDASGSKQM